MQKLEFIIERKDSGKRIDVLAASLSGITRSQIQRAIEKGYMSVNKSPVRAHYKAKSGDCIHIVIPEKTDELIPENIAIEILYTDDFIIVLNKPAGIVVYPAAGHQRGTLMNAVAYHSKRLASVGGPLRPGIVHRLDKDTSGLMVISIDDSAYYSLIEQFKRKTIRRKYSVLVYGDMTYDRGEISGKIGRSESDRKKMSTKVRKGKKAVTTWEVKERFKDATLLEATLGTGRTHQIRVHFASIGHPVLGDRTYGRKTTIGTKKKISFPRQMLHAGLLGFYHPETGQYMEFTRPLPGDMKERIQELKRL